MKNIKKLYFHNKRLFSTVGNNIIPIGEIKTYKNFVNKSRTQDNSNLKVDSSYYIQNGKLSFLKYNKKGIPLIKDNYYESFGVKNNDNYNKIREHYLLIVKYYHPDKNPEYLVSNNLFYM